ncbi:MAG: hypothetical protein A3G81_18100 [Betaproteobacteria bacterium RIFCSPLOWO2_12_FULL_65_14]|nr:MAG: hypothetical protein A3G81_18100 [Betaproteobacteria bacterium RIFCSPLOWO2_12_FULL_65_14]
MALEETRPELARAASELQKARTEARAMSAELAALRKDLAEEKTASDRLRAELIAAQAFLQAEKAIGARLRDELLKAKEQLALANRPRAVQPAQPPMVIRALPSGSAIGRGVPAR